MGDYVREDLHFAGLSFTWWRKFQDRAGWRAAIMSAAANLGLGGV